MPNHTSTTQSALAPEAIFGHVHRMPWEQPAPARRDVRRRAFEASEQRDLVATA